MKIHLPQLHQCHVAVLPQQKNLYSSKDMGPSEWTYKTGHGYLEVGSYCMMPPIVCIPLPWLSRSDVSKCSLSSNRASLEGLVHHMIRVEELPALSEEAAESGRDAVVWTESAPPLSQKYKTQPSNIHLTSPSTDCGHPLPPLRSIQQHQIQPRSQSPLWIPQAVFPLHHHLKQRWDCLY